MAECYVEPNAQENAKTELPWWKWARLGAGTTILIIVLLFSPRGAGLVWGQLPVNRRWGPVARGAQYHRRAGRALS